MDTNAFDNFICGDVDGDTCEDCHSGYSNVSNDGYDYDGDGACDLGDDDDDDDGALDDVDSDDNDEFTCSDDDGDSCDDCSDGSYGLDDDGADNDGDGWCNVGDAWPDCAYDNANDPSVYPYQIDVDPYDECGNCHGDGFADACIGTDECDDSPNTDCVDMVFDLHLGANLVSFYALPVDVSIASMFSGFDDGTGIMGEGVGAIKVNGAWIGSLIEMSQDDGYWIKVDEDMTFIVESADPVNYDLDGEVIYDIHYGNNLISYSFQSSQTIADGLGDASANIYALAGEGVATMYNPGSDGDGDGWVGSLQYFEGLGKEDFSKSIS